MQRPGSSPVSEADRTRLPLGADRALPRRTRIAACVALGVLLWAAPAAADGYMSAQVGGFAPWSGNAGIMTSIQILGSNASGRSRWGGEFEYRQFDTRVEGVPNVDVDSYLLRGMWQYHFRPEAAVAPYLGLGLALVITDLDDDKVDSAKGFNAIDPVGAGLDGVFLLGVSARIPGVDYLSVFAEGRVGLAFSATGKGSSSDVVVDNVGGGSGSAGLRFRF
jgi:hypothetical protein